MSTQSTCPHCGYEGPEDALFCAHCGRSVTGIRNRFWEWTYTLIDNMSPYTFGVLGLASIVLLTRLAYNTIITLGFPAALVTLFIGLGCFSASLGWLWHQALPNPLRFRRFMLLCATAVLFMWVLSSIDTLATNGLDNRIVGYRLPGILVQATSGRTKTSIWSDVMWWTMAVCGLVLSLVADWLQRNRPQTLPIEVE